MNNNDVLRSILQVLQLNDSSLANIFNLAHHPADQATLSGLLMETGDTGYTQCSDQQLEHFLDGLIVLRRGPKDISQPAAQPDTPALDNNIILKKLRIAFDLKEDDLIELISMTGYDISKSELSAIFRKPGNKHYRACSDDFLLAFLQGLSFRQWT